MNKVHMEICSSDEWAAYVRDELIPWVTEGKDLGDHVLEMGPGPGRTTEVLAALTPRLTAIELDERMAEDLAARLGKTVDVVRGDATRSGLPDAAFSAVTCFTMLHHLPDKEAQNLLFAEARRVLAPGGLFLGTDGVASADLRSLHDGDIYLPVPPEELPDRLEEAGFVDISVDVKQDRLRFAARRPPAIRH
jgi:SAM-dependent methyltransferase